MSTTSPTDSPPEQSKVDAIYDLLADLPTVDNASLPAPPPSAFTKELEALQDSLNLRLDTLQSAINGIQRPPLPSAPVPATPTPAPVLKPCAQKPCAQLSPLPWLRLHLLRHPLPPLPHVPHPLPPHSPPWQKLPHDHPLLSLRLPVAGASHPLAVQRSPQEVVSHLNTVLTSEGHLATLSAAQWTAKNNLVVTAGPNTTVHHLTSASHLISKCLATFLSADHSPLPVQTRDNCKWAHLLINRIPTGASPTWGPFSPSELHAALLADNPAYRGLRLTQPPSWVRAPASYTPGSVSSLVLTFEDSLGDSLCSLLAGQTLFAFGHSGELKHWKAKPHHTGRAMPAASSSTPDCTPTLV
ncbi:hypothetical protein EDB84DRAFT_1566751 [Lactarius hengduanensis]|nr:hypothetical protein EDB84DRAFT_1571797 [Lactarius hengduanensis]KAH9017601.1 hypothetical protein EDB84DRAFT_1566751 [Lactarius hengduanensis]